jgi:2-polyprenyl-6-hydroxyphenyl methylase/3-demethylubiquinone-9 3-methyltransferase
MDKDKRWEEAQATEVEFWDGMSREDFNVLRVLADNAGKAPLLQSLLNGKIHTALEVGCGPFGLGVIGYLPEIPFRIAMDPLPPTPMDGNDPLRSYVAGRRKAMEYVVGYGEEIPVKSDSLDLVICCNVIDHASRPAVILDEIHRVLKREGLFFFDVHTFSVLGLGKWHAWTKHRHKEEMLVKAHPYRMFEAAIRRMLAAHGFRVRKLTGHTPFSLWVGHARISTFLGEKCGE